MCSMGPTSKTAISVVLTLPFCFITCDLENVMFCVYERNKMMIMMRGKGKERRKKGKGRKGTGEERKERKRGYGTGR